MASGSPPTGPEVAAVDTHSPCLASIRHLPSSPGKEQTQHRSVYEERAGTPIPREQSLWPTAHSPCPTQGQPITCQIAPRLPAFIGDSMCTQPSIVQGTKPYPGARLEALCQRSPGQTREIWKKSPNEEHLVLKGPKHNTLDSLRYEKFLYTKMQIVGVKNSVQLKSA